MGNPLDGKKRSVSHIQLGMQQPRKPMPFAKLIRDVSIGEIYPTWKMLDNAATNFLLHPAQKAHPLIEQTFKIPRITYAYSTVEKIETDQITHIEFHVSYPDDLTTMFWELKSREAYEIGTNQYPFKPKYVELASLLACLTLMNFESNCRALDRQEADVISRFEINKLNILNSPRSIKFTLNLFHILSHTRMSNAEYVAKYKPIEFGEWAIDAIYYFINLLEENGCTVNIQQAQR